MKRRRLLQLTGGCALVPFAGCSALSSAPDSPPNSARAVSVVEATCEDAPSHVTHATFLPKKHEVVVTGSIVGRAPCESLGLRVLTAESSEHADDVGIRVVPQGDIDGCEPCSARLDYVGTVTFDADAYPTSVDLAHMDKPTGRPVYGESFERQS
ncbi:hypothetical protein [Haloprofundus halophilus]|uniref:hypothetical protein n=1 Tax=Haloprofundus halophilus TaxID=2283527 RepID=UPI0013008912|nr:hypothetical protein [Haloprofundus halophilus]